MTRNAIVDALGVLKAGRIVDLTHLVHPGIQRFGPFPAMRTEARYTVAESGFHVEQVSFVTQYGTHVDAPEHFVEGRRTLERIELERARRHGGGPRDSRHGRFGRRAGEGGSTARSTCSSPITIRSRSWRTSTSCPRRAA